MRKPWVAGNEGKLSHILIIASSSVLLFGKTAQQLGLSSDNENDLSVPISASQVHEQKSPESATVIKRQLEQILISKQDEPIRSTWIEPAPDMVEEANDLLLQERMALSSSYCSLTSYPSPIDPQTKPPVQEGKSRPRPLGRRSVLIGLVGGIIAIGGGVFVQGSTIIPAQPTVGSTRWTDPQWIAGQGSQTTPALALSSNGTLHLVFVANDSSGLMYTSSQDNGATWGTYHAVTGQFSKTTPALAISSNGILHLVFVANNNGNGLLYTSSQDNGATWGDI
ncbi:MAG TPA: sialidase family protein, partial [Ktedonobacteraceae bacterium]